MTQLKITLVDSEPEVWRQVWVPAEFTLSALHGVIQCAMGWENLSDYQFALGVGQMPLETQTQVGALAEQSGIFYYTYDAQSGWLHRIEVETASSELSGTPVCMDGSAACPPEGSGGVWGYDELLARLENTDDPEYLDLIEKYGSFDPDRFDLDAANKRLQSQQ